MGRTWSTWTMRKEAEKLVLLRHAEQSLPCNQSPIQQRQTAARFSPYTHIFLFSKLTMPNSLNTFLYITCISQLTASALLVRAASAAVCECHPRTKIWTLEDDLGTRQSASGSLCIAEAEDYDNEKEENSHCFHQPHH